MVRTMPMTHPVKQAGESMESGSATRQKLARWRSSDPQLSLLGSLGTVADVLAIVGAVSWVIALVTRKDLPKSLLAIFLGILTLACVVMVFRLQNTLRELQMGLTGRAKVGDSLPSLAESIADLSRATVAISDRTTASETVFTTHLEAACRSFAEALRTATASNCRVTVQELYAPDPQVPPSGHSSEEFAVRTIARSSWSESAAHAEGGVDWVGENTDFDAVFLRGKPYFLCNDLVAELAAGYRNSHWPPERLKEMQASQNYPYRSTIVWPLRGRITGPGPDNHWLILGFLSVDSPNTDTFVASSIVPLGETFAHALYAGLNMYENRQLEAAT